MIDPLSEMIATLQPKIRVVKSVSASGYWRFRKVETGQPYFCIVLSGSCRLNGCESIEREITEGDFLLAPSGQSFEICSSTPPSPRVARMQPQVMLDGEIRHGDLIGPVDVRLLVGHCRFEAGDPRLWMSLLPELIHIRGHRRLRSLVELIADESSSGRPAGEFIVARLIEALLVEAIRSAEGLTPSKGLVRGLADQRVSGCIAQLHQNPGKAWTVTQLAEIASLSRSAFYHRFRQTVGTTPMNYLLRWRMALAMRMLRERTGNISAIADRVGYSSASTFTVAFTKFAGVPPGRYARQQETIRSWDSDRTDR